jgi:hypothetical protein
MCMLVCFLVDFKSLLCIICFNYHRVLFSLFTISKYIFFQKGTQAHAILFAEAALIHSISTFNPIQISIFVFFFSQTCSFAQTIKDCSCAFPKAQFQIDCKFINIFIFNHMHEHRFCFARILQNPNFGHTQFN